MVATEGPLAPREASMATGREMERLRAEHAALSALARIILSMAQDPAPPPPADLASARAALRDTLVRHLKCEDWALYPRLRASGVADLVRLTRAFELEMGDLADEFVAYDAKWTADRVATDRAGFCRETKIIFDLLQLRIEREEHELYPLADRLYAAAAPVIARSGSDRQFPAERDAPVLPEPRHRLFPRIGQL